MSDNVRKLASLGAMFFGLMLAIDCCATQWMYHRTLPGVVEGFLVFFGSMLISLLVSDGL